MLTYRCITNKNDKKFRRLFKENFTTEKELKHFSCNFENISCLGKIKPQNPPPLPLRKIYNRLSGVPGYSVKNWKSAKKYHLKLS